MRSGKRQIIEGIELPNQEKIRTFGEKKTYKQLGILEVDTIEVVMKKKKSFSDKQQKFSKPNSAVGISSKGKHLGCLFCKILGTILEIDEGKTLTNGPENKKVNDDA